MVAAVACAPLGGGVMYLRSLLVGESISLSTSSFKGADSPSRSEPALAWLTMEREISK